MAKKSIAFDAYVGKNQITLSEGLLKRLYKEIVEQIGTDFKEMDIEVVIKISHKTVVVTKEKEEKLSDFNLKLKQALEFNTKKK